MTDVFLLLVGKCEARAIIRLNTPRLDMIKVFQKEKTMSDEKKDFTEELMMKGSELVGRVKELIAEGKKLLDYGFPFHA